MFDLFYVMLNVERHACMLILWYIGDLVSLTMAVTCYFIPKYREFGGGIIITFGAAASGKRLMVQPSYQNKSTANKWNQT
jgi:hypothetical protein